MKKVFSSNGDVRKNAILNWRTEHHQPIQNMNVLAEGYLKGAIELAKISLKDTFNFNADIYIFPMLFSANHGIELYEKSICWSLNILLDCKEKFDITHDIKSLWEKAKAKIIRYGFGYGHEKKEFYEMIKVLEDYLEELAETITNDEIQSVNKTIDFSRYPIRTNNEYHFYLKTADNVVVDLENFLEVFNNIYDCLHLLAEHYYDLVYDNMQKNTN